MKRIIILLMMPVALLTVQCSQDKGNYEYHDFNEITITNLDGRTFSVLNDGVDKLYLDPGIEMTEVAPADYDSDRFRYLWTATYVLGSGRGARTLRDTIWRGRIIDWMPPANFRYGVVNTLRLQVIDRQTNLLFGNPGGGARMIASAPYYRGWMLAGDDAAGNAKVQMLSMLEGRDTVLYADLFKNSGLPALQGAVNCLHALGPDASNANKIWFITKSGSYWLNNVSLESSPANIFNNMMPSPPAQQLNVLDVVYPQYYRLNTSTWQNEWGSSAYDRFVLCDDGNLYGTRFSNYGDTYSVPLNRLVENPNTRFRVKGPLLCDILCITSNNSTSGMIVWYDETNQRFMRTVDGMNTPYSVVLQDGGSDPFPWNQPAGRTYLHGENTLDNSIGGGLASFALMGESATNRAVIYKFRATGANPPKGQAFDIYPAPAHLLSADAWTFAENQTSMFYVAGGKLYWLNYQGTTEVDITGQLGGGEVTMAKIDHVYDPNSLLANIRNSLYVATWNGTESTLTKYNYTISGPNITLTQAPRCRWATGNVKIKSMNWRGIE